MNNSHDAVKADHLYLLIGANAVPNWVAARLLVKSPAESQIYLVHSNRNRSVASRLALLLESDPFHHKPPKYIDVGNAADADQIYEAIQVSVTTIRSGQIGLNYTGGTSVMSIQAYRAVENNTLKGLPAPIFSYLDAETADLYFEKSRRLPTGFPPLPALSADETALKLAQLFKLADSAHALNIEPKTRLWKVSSTLAEIFSSRDDNFIKGWRKWIVKLRSNSQTQDLQWPTFVQPVAEALRGDLPPTTTLKELCRSKTVHFTEATHLLAWLEGPWLEDYVFSVLDTNRNEFGLTDCGRNIMGNFTITDLEIDVAFTRSYQLYFISCYSGSDTGSGKLKLMEAFVRARQFGGDQARAALVCMTDAPEMLTRNVASVFDNKKQDRRIQVFGRKHLPELAKHLGDWLSS